MEKDTQHGSAIIKVLRSDSVVDIWKEYLELGIDRALESGVLENIPLMTQWLEYLARSVP